METLSIASKLGKHISARLDSKDQYQIIDGLQELLKTSQTAVEPGLLATIDRLRDAESIAIKFWAKKTFAKYSPKTTVQETTEVPPAGDSVDGLLIHNLLKKLNSVESSWVSMEVITKICESRLREAIPPLKIYLEKCTDVLQISYLVKILGKCFPGEDLLDTLAPYLKHDDDRVVANAVEGIEALKNSDIVPFLSELLEHRSNRVRTNAAKAIARFDFRMTFHVLSTMLQDQEKPHFAISALFAIRELKDPLFLPHVVELLNNDLIFLDAIRTIECIGGENGRSVLKEFIRTTSDQVKRQTAEFVLNRF